MLLGVFVPVLIVSYSSWQLHSPVQHDPPLLYVFSQAEGFKYSDLVMLRNYYWK